MPRTREQYEEIKNARKQEILNSAVKIFCQKGYENAKIDDIMKDCGCSHGLMYHYFRNKDDIFVEILTNAAEHSNEMYERSLSQNIPARVWFEQVIRHFLTGLAEDENFVYFIHFMSNLHMIRHDFDYSSLPVKFNRSIRPMPVFAHMFGEGQREGFIRADETPEALASLFVAVLQGLAYQKVFAMTRGRQMTVPRVRTLLEIFCVPAPKGD